MSFDKENVGVPSTPPNGSKINASSPVSSDRTTSPKRALRPLSPNKTNASGNGGVGKLNFLQNDNIDEHFNHIHTTHDEIQDQLNSLEACTKQTAADLGQLVDRSKNNNQHLNKLLQNIASYSDEVITEGNATKNDITNIISKLDAFRDQIYNTNPDKNDYQNIKEHIDGIKASISQSLSEIPTSKEITTIIESFSNKSHSKEVDNELKSLQQSLPAAVSESLKKILPGLLRQELSQHKENLNTSTSKTVDDKMTILNKKISELTIPSTDAISLNLDDIIKREVVPLLDSNHVDLSSYLSTEDTIALIVPPILAEVTKNLQSSQSAEENYRNDLNKLASRIYDSNNTNSKSGTLEDSISHLTSLVKSQSESINKLTIESQAKQAAFDSQSKYTDLESRYNLLESKYQELCKAYESKYVDLKHLNSQYQSLTQKSGSLTAKLMSAASDSSSSDVAINKSPLAKISGARQLHNYSMGTIPQLESQVPSPQKRIVSSPVANKVKKDYLHDLSNIRSNNSDDES